MEAARLTLGNAPKKPPIEEKEEYTAVAPPPQLMGDATIVPPAAGAEAPPPGVKKEHWDKLLALRQKRDKIEAEDRKRASSRIKHLEKSALHQVVSQSRPEDLVEMGLSHLASGGSTKPKRKHVNDPPPPIPPEHDLNSYLHLHKNFEPVPDQFAPKNKLEEQMEEAISKGDHNLAEKLSEKLAEAIAAKDTFEAVRARDFALGRKAEIDRTQNKKKQRLRWT